MQEKCALRTFPQWRMGAKFGHQMGKLTLLKQRLNVAVRDAEENLRRLEERLVTKVSASQT